MAHAVAHHRDQRVLCAFALRLKGADQSAHANLTHQCPTDARAVPKHIANAFGLDVKSVARAGAASLWGMGVRRAMRLGSTSSQGAGRSMPQKMLKKLPAECRGLRCCVSAT